MKISSSVRSGGGTACRTEEVELLSLVTFLVVDELGATRAGGERDTSSGLGRCMRGRIVGTQ